jgi:hypothetical protein
MEAMDMLLDTPPSSLDRTLPGDVLPVQFFAEVGALRDPERRLRLAVLKNALRYFQEYASSSDARRRLLYEDAADWFFDPDRSEPFSFENVCDALSLDPDYIRSGLRRWREREFVRTASPKQHTQLRDTAVGRTHRYAA